MRTLKATILQKHIPHCSNQKEMQKQDTFKHAARGQSSDENAVSTTYQFVTIEIN